MVRHSHMRRHLPFCLDAVEGHQIAVLTVLAMLLMTSVGLSAQTNSSNQNGKTTEASSGTRAAAPSLLRELNNSMEALVARVSPAVVQIVVTGYGFLEQHRGQDVPVVGRQRGIGSGVIVDSDGYIITNAHVVEGAQQIQVVLSHPFANSKGQVDSRERQVLPAKVIGIDHESDLAVIKVEATSLPTMSLADSQGVHQGQLVFAIGSPEGLDDSVTMGVVSSPLRQPVPDSPMVYIQTDASINPGNSGGPLVDDQGALVGINTMIFTLGGGSEGIGFAIPADCVRFVYQSLRRYGQVYRAEIGAQVQEITPDLAVGLGLTRKWGVIVSDVLPGGMSAAAGLRAGDIVMSVDHQLIEDLPSYTAALYLHPLNQPVEVRILRGGQTLAFAIPFVVHQEGLEYPPIGPDNLLSQLRVFAIDLNEHVLPFLKGLRSGSGVLVVAQAINAASVQTGLQPGDVIRTVNRITVHSLEQLRTVMSSMREGEPVVLQIERQGHLQYLAFALNG